MFLSPPCNNNGCYCDQNCHKMNDCCSDIADIGCHPATSIVSPTPTDILGKSKSNAQAIHYSISFLNN